MRLRILVLVTVVVFFVTLMMVPRIIEGSKSSAADAHTVVPSPMQGPRPEITVGESIRNDTSPPVREMKQQPVFKPRKEANKNPKIAHPHKDAPDPVVQASITADAFTAANMPATEANFDGIQYPGVACNCVPPDTNGEVGATQYVQIVNEGFQVFNKTTGASSLGPSGISTIWGGFGGVCEFNGSGDPVVMYDQIANRWVISQFAGVSIPTDECIAVSTTGDATGSYHRYDFHLGSNFFDYPHLSVWPDGYYMAMNVFNSSGTSFLGPQPFVFDRTRMLAGLPATFITPGITNGPSEATYLPADLDGSTLPPAGAPATFVQWPGSGAYKIFHFHADFATPANSSFTVFANPVAAGFTQLCPSTASCVPQSGTTSRLDALGDRLMFRVAYRNFGTHESIVGNYTVSSGSVAGFRWFELRNVTNGPVTVHQESTYQPDSTWRWLGSAAMDKDGNIALGYSASNSTIFPQLRYAGRLATDPLNVLGQGEAILFAGTGSQSGSFNRWGDYSSMTVDPVDDCTFWLTSEYYATTSSFNWRTRIGSFRFPTCGSGNPTPTPTPTPTPSGDNTRVPPATQIVDSNGDVWTLSNGAILRNGAGTGGGGSQILYCSRSVYALGTDSSWWRWTGSGWIQTGLTDPCGGPESLNNTRVPPATQIVDSNGNVWTLSNGAILRNGAGTGGGGSKILYCNHIVYALGTDSAWWRWTGSGWTQVGSVDPCAGSESPNNTRVPPGTQIVDSSGNVWTLSNGAILRNGAGTGGGGSKILYCNHIVYALGTDSAWWRWTGSGWTQVGSIDPCGGPESPNNTRVPLGTQIVDSNGDVWTLSNGGAILRNGAGTGGGGPEILYCSRMIYALGIDSAWWRWTGSGWIQVGPTDPCGGSPN